MRILLVGPVSAPGGLVGTYYRTFKSLGHKVKVFDTYREKVHFWPSPKGDRIIDRAIRKIQNVVTDKLSKRLFQKHISSFKKFDFILIFALKWFGPSILRDLKTHSEALLFHFNADSPFDEHNYHPTLIKSIPFYDCHFTWSKRLMNKLYAHGATKVEYLPFAWDPMLHYPVNISGEEKEIYGSRVSFIGNWSPKRENYLVRLTTYDLAIWGSPVTMWGRAQNFQALKSHWTRQSVFGKKFSKVCRATDINLNILRKQNKMNDSTNMRTFEVLGSGGFLLTERTEEQCEFFEEGKEIECFETSEELKSKIAYYLKHEGEREKIADAGHKKVHEHTYKDRVQKIIEVYGKLS